MELVGKTAVITGALGGIGAETARLFAKRGANVVLTDFQTENGNELAADIGSNARFVQHDVRNQKDWDDALALAERTFGSVNILVNNAGVISFGSLQDCSEEEYRRVTDINQLGVYLGMRSAAEFLKRAGGGAIVNTSSAYGLVAGSGAFAYFASKFAVTGMTKAAAFDLGSWGIRVNSIHPGVIDTPMNRNTPEEVRKVALAAAEALPIGRMGTPEEMAELIAFLASDASSFCTGSSFVADGGWTAG